MVDQTSAKKLVVDRKEEKRRVKDRRAEVRGDKNEDKKRQVKGTRSSLMRSEA